MHPSFCIGFQVHHPLSFVEHDPKNLKEKILFARMAQQAYVPFVKWYQKRLLDYPQLKGFLSLSGAFFDYCSDFPDIGDDLIDHLRRIVSTERVEVVAEPYHHTLKSLDDRTILFDEIQRHHDLAHDLFGTRSRSIRLIKQQNYESVALLSQYIGFHGLLLDTPGTECQEITQRVLTEDEWRMVESKAPLNKEGNPVVSSVASMHLGMSAQVKKQFYVAIDAGVDGSVFADDLLEDGYPHVQESFVLDIEEVCTRKNGLVFLDAFMTRLMDRGGRLSSLSEWEDVYSTDNSLVHAIDSLVLNTEERFFDHPLQETAWSEFLTLVEAFEQGDKEQLEHMVSTIEWLGRDEHFHAMISDVSPYDSTYEAFEAYIKGVRSIKKDLQK